MQTALVTHPDGLLHQTPARVHEQVARLDFVLRTVEDLPLPRIDAPLAETAYLTTLHDPAYVDHILTSRPDTGFVALDADTDDETVLSPGSKNVILRAVGGARYAEAVFPRLSAFDPELILISADFDVHRDDPLAEPNWTTDDYAWLTRSLAVIAKDHCQGRLVSILEGATNSTLSPPQPAPMSIP